MANKENSAPVKVADFGVAVELPENGLVTSGMYKSEYCMLFFVSKVSSKLLKVYSNFGNTTRTTRGKLITKIGKKHTQLLWLKL